MIESLPRFVPARSEGVVLPDGTILPLAPTPDYYPKLPYHLRKYVLKGVAKENGGVIPGDIWNQRAIPIERRIEGIIAGLPEVESVTRHEKDSEEDLIGHDLTVQLKNGLTVYIQVKSSGDGIIQFKKALRNAYSRGRLNNEGQVRRIMADLGIVLINGSETRSDEEIINDSFYPQLERVIARAQKMQANLNNLPERFRAIVERRKDTQILPVPKLVA
jgi:hypothetical protein